jgi:hypothetical protein
MSKGTTAILSANWSVNVIFSKIVKILMRNPVQGGGNFRAKLKNSPHISYPP